MTCQYRVISYKKCTIWGGGVLMVEEAVYVGLGRTWELSILLVNFAVNLKRLEKIKPMFKIKGLIFPVEYKGRDFLPFFPEFLSLFLSHVYASV